MSRTRNEIRKLVALSLPVVVTQLGTVLMGVVDTAMVGHVGVTALGAASLGHLWATSTLLVAMGVLFGLDPIITQAHGRGDERTLGLSLQRGTILSALLSLPVVGLWLLTEAALSVFGQSSELSRLAQSYVAVQIPSIPIFLMFTTLRQYLQGRGIVMPAMWSVVVANLANVLFNWVLIFGHFGFPALGLLGAGIATALTRLVMLGTLLGTCRWLKLYENGWTPWSTAAFKLSRFKEILGHGLPVTLQFSLENWAFQIAILMAGQLGTAQLATHAIAHNLSSVSFMLPLGISLGAVTRVGNLIGEGRLRRAQLSAWLALLLSSVVMTAAALFFIASRHILPRLYTEDANIVEAVAGILPIVAAFQVFDGAQVVGGGILRGMGKTLPAAAFNLMGHYLLALPLAWFFSFRTGLGLPGIWWGLSVGLAVVALLMALWIWRRGPARWEHR